MPLFIHSPVLAITAVSGHLPSNKEEGVQRIARSVSSWAGGKERGEEGFLFWVRFFLLVL